MLVYSATHSVSGRRCIGKTVRTLSHAKARHKERAKHQEKYKAFNLFHTAMHEDGPDVFQWEVIYRGTSDDDLMGKEREFIQQFDTTDPTKGYNMTPGGWGNGKKLTDGHKELLRVRSSGSGNPCFGLYGTDHPASGHVKTPEGLANISAAAKRPRRVVCDSPAHIG